MSTEAVAGVESEKLLISRPMSAELAAERAAEQANLKKQKAFDEAADRFKQLGDKLGGVDKVKGFLDIYGTEGFLPEKQMKVNPTAGATAAKELLKDHKIDTTIKDRSASELGLPSRPAGYGAAYLSHDWQIKQITGVDHPVNLKDEAWSLINQSTSIFHGFVIRENGSLVRARFPAFELRPKAGKSGTDAINSIPDFEIYDSSSISIKETSNEFESSMARNSFSSLAIQAAVSGGYGAYSVAASGGYNKETSKGENKGKFEARKEYTATYNFPRARIFLDEYSLQLTPRCAERLVVIRKAHDKVASNIAANKPSDSDGAVTRARQLCEEFTQQYGYLFATTVQIGGQLLATRSAESLGSSNETTQRDAMKISAALSFGTPYVSGSGSMSKEDTTSDKSKQSSVTNASALTWSAQGGNTLLVASPPEWANSLASFTTWRAFERDEILPVIDLVSKLTDASGKQVWSDIRDVFREIRQEKFSEITAPPGTWTGKIRLEPVFGTAKLVNYQQGGTTYAVFADKFNNSTEKEIVFTVLDADIRSKHKAKPTLAALYADNPLFLVTSDQYARDDANDGGQIQGLTVDKDGFLCTQDPSRKKITRWSLRPAATQVDFRQRWTPNKTLINDGDEVMLYCHSLTSGFYRNAEEAPYYAPCVYSQKDTNNGRLRVPSVPPSEFLSVKRHRSNNTQYLFYKYSHPEVKMMSELDYTKVEALAQVYDRGLSFAQQDRDVESLRNLYGFRDTNNVAARDMVSDTMLEDDQRLQIESSTEAWAAVVNMPAKARFRVKYI